MNITLNQVNTLPVRTWKWLGVNGTAVEEPIPAEFLPWESKPLSLPNGVQQENGAFDGADEIETGMGQEAENFVKQNHNAGIHLTVENGVKIQEPLLLDYLLQESCPTLADYNTIYAKENSQITVVMHYHSQGDASVFHGSLTKIFAEKGATVRLVQVQLLDDTAFHFDDVGVIIKENAHVEVIHIELGARKLFSGCKAILAERRSRFESETIYLGDKSRIIDMNYVAQHIGRETESEIHANGALLDESQKIYRGTIDFVRGAAYSVGHEGEYTLLFSPRVRNRTAPLILCGEENVEGQHAASIGKIDQTKLFYLMSRGLSEAQAKQIVIEAQFTPAIEKISVEALQDSVRHWLKERMGME